jgi:hypothetical protein
MIAGRMFDVARQLQKNREKFAGMRRPTPLAQKVAGGEEVISALYQKQRNEQEQNAASAPGALQKERSEEGRRQRDDRQREAQGRTR